MTIKQFRDYMLEEMDEQNIKMPFYFDHYPTGVKIPLIVYRTNDKGFSADNIVYFKSLSVEVGLYTPTKDLTTESALETIFTSAEWYYSKDCFYDADNCVYITRYNMEV